MALQKIALASVTALVGIGMLGFVSVSYSISNFENNITIVNSSELVSETPPPIQNTVEEVIEEAEIIEEKYPVTILLVGSDTRVGQGSGFGKAGGARSDTTILVKMNAERTHAAVISIARDLRVKIPSCKTTSGGILNEQYNKFNAAYAFGGVDCMLATLKENYNIEVNHIAVVDFRGFQDIVNIIGGVQVCVAEDIYDKASGLDLKAGKQTLNGEEALAFVRARKNIGDGSDISRSERQKMFLASLFKTAQNNGTFYNVPRLYALMDSAAKSLSTDEELASVQKMLSLALDMNKIGTKNVQFVYLPWKSRGDGSIEFKDEAYKILELFNAGDFPIIGTAEIPAKTADASDASPSPSEKYNKSESYNKEVFTADLDMCDANIN